MLVEGAGVGTASLAEAEPPAAAAAGNSTDELDGAAVVSIDSATVLRTGISVFMTTGTGLAASGGWRFDEHCAIYGTG